MSIISFLFISLIVSYNYTYVELMPDYFNVKFKEFRVGSFLFELPDFFSLVRPNSFQASINYPGFSLILREIKFSNTTFEEARCYPHNYEIEFNREEDDDISSLSKSKSFIFIPKSIEKNSAELHVVFIGNNWCAKLSANFKQVNKEKNFDVAIISFKNTIVDFFNYYGFVSNVVTSDKGFRTLLGIINQNNQFTIDTSFILDGDTTFNIKNKSARYNIIYFNSEDLWNKLEQDRISRYSLLRLHAYSRVHLKNLFDFRWSYMNEDFQFSHLYSGQEEIIMPSSKSGHPERFLIFSHAKTTSARHSFSDYIMVEMDIAEGGVFSIENYGKPIKPNYNVLYGYWVRAKKSVQAM